MGVPKIYYTWQTGHVFTVNLDTHKLGDFSQWHLLTNYGLKCKIDVDQILSCYHIMLGDTCTSMPRFHAQKLVSSETDPPQACNLLDLNLVALHSCWIIGFAALKASSLRQFGMWVGKGLKWAKSGFLEKRVFGENPSKCHPRALAYDQSVRQYSNHHISWPVYFFPVVWYASLKFQLVWLSKPDLFKIDPNSAQLHYHMHAPIWNATLPAWQKRWKGKKDYNQQKARRDKWQCWQHEREDSENNMAWAKGHHVCQKNASTHVA